MGQKTRDGIWRDAAGLPRSHAKRISDLRYKIMTKFNWSPEKFSKWWHTTHQLLDNKTPYNMSQDEDDLKRLEDLVSLACDIK